VLRPSVLRPSVLRPNAIQIEPSFTTQTGALARTCDMGIVAEES
jgi:hypothetical protein